MVPDILYLDGTCNHEQTDQFSVLECLGEEAPGMGRTMNGLGRQVRSALGCFLRRIHGLWLLAIILSSIDAGESIPKVFPTEGG